MKLSRFLAVAVVSLFLGLSGSFAQGNASASSVASAAGAQGGTGIMNWPLVVGGSLALGSGTGVGGGHEVGLYQIQPMIGAWFPGYGFIRLGYGLYTYNEEDADEEKFEVEHSEFDVELGVHVMGLFYLTGAYSRVKSLNDLGDVSWNEWSLGGGTIINMFAKTILYVDVGYHWVREHYDPFSDRSVSGGRMQCNIGFAVFLY